MKFKTYDIEYDTDGEEVDLPQEITLDVSDEDMEDFDPSCHLADCISDETGYCVLKFQWEQLSDLPTKCAS